jgi:hypothetical protein
MRTAIAFGIALTMASAGAVAQTQETETTTKTKTKVEVKGGRDVTVRGCLDRATGGGYVLTRLSNDRDLDRRGYALVTDEDLSKHQGELVEIKGKTTEDGDGKVAVEARQKTEGDHGKDEAVTKTEATSGTRGLPFLGVKSIKKLASTCN